MSGKEAPVRTGLGPAGTALKQSSKKSKPQQKNLASTLGPSDLFARVPASGDEDDDVAPLQNVQHPSPEIGPDQGQLPPPPAQLDPGTQYLATLFRTELAGVKD